MVVVPVAAVAHVGGGKLPVARGVFDALEDAALLFLARNVQVELDDARAVADEVALEGIDVCLLYTSRCV